MPEERVPAAEDAAGITAASVKKEAKVSDNPLSEAEYFFVHALLYGGEWKSYLKERRIALSMLADSINEKLMDVVGDTVIEFAGEDPQLIEDYIGELTELVPE